MVMIVRWRLKEKDNILVVEKQCILQFRLKEDCNMYQQVVKTIR